MRMMLRRTYLPVLLAHIATSLSLGAAQGIPYVPPEIHQDVRRLQGDRITFCIWADTSPTAALDRAMAELVGEVLLTETVIVEYRQPGDLAPDEFLEEIYVQLGSTCDAIAGFVLAADGFPEWLVPTRPYLAAPYVTLVADGSPHARFGDVPANGIVGSHAYTEGDYALIAYQQSLAVADRWRRFGYTSIEHMAEHLRRGTLQAGLAWQPSWAQVARDASHGLRVVPNDPVQTVPSAVGFVLRTDNAFLRNMIDVALNAIDADDTLVELAASFDLVHVR